MTTSGTTTYSVNESEIIQDAFETAEIYAAGETVSTDDYSLARRKLNMLAKQLSGSTDFSTGMKLWARKTGYLFLAKDTGTYSIGPSGDHCTESYSQTTLSASAAGGAGTITVASATGIATTYHIGVELDDGSIQWTTVNGAPVGTVVTLTASLTGAASSGNVVFCYQTKARNPLELLSVVRRNKNGQDTPVAFDMSVAEYEAIADKSADGTPSRLYWEHGLTNSSIKLDVQPDTPTDVLRIVFLSPAEDYSATTDTLEYPQAYYRFISAQLACDLCLPFGKEISASLKLLRDESQRIAQNSDPQTSFHSFEPDRV